MWTMKTPEISASVVWKIAGAVATVVLAWVWVQSQFLGVTQFEVYASGVQQQQQMTTKALLMQELRWLQAQRRIAKKEGDTDEVARLNDEIDRVKLDIEDLKAK